MGNRVESASRTLDVRIAVRNEDGRLKPGMFADVEIVNDGREKRAHHSRQAHCKPMARSRLFSSRSTERSLKNARQAGLEQHGRVQVLEGVKEGEKVVTDGSFILKSEMLKGEMGEDKR